jgi:hypothetical protein
MTETTQKTGRVWEDNIKIDLKNIVEKNVDWVCVIYNKTNWRVVVKTILNFRTLENEYKWVTSFSTMTRLRGVS